MIPADDSATKIMADIDRQHRIRTLLKLLSLLLIEMPETRRYVSQECEAMLATVEHWANGEQP